MNQHRGLQLIPLRVPAGKGEDSTLVFGTLEDHIKYLPPKVQMALRQKPTKLQQVVAGGVAEVSSSTGAGAVTQRINRRGVDLLSATQDS